MKMYWLYFICHNVSMKLFGCQSSLVYSKSKHIAKLPSFHPYVPQEHIHFTFTLRSSHCSSLS